MFNLGLAMLGMILPRIVQMCFLYDVIYECTLKSLKGNDALKGTPWPKYSRLMGVFIVHCLLVQFIY